MISQGSDLIQRHWSENELPGLNCAVYGDGTVTLLNIYAASEGGSKQHHVFPVADTTIESLLRYNDDVWSEIQPHPASLAAGDRVLVFGEGAMGNEGFVALTEGNKLIWAVFSTESNPFLKLEIRDNIVKAYSDFLIYTINLANPADIQISFV